jgi:hypothetical protein
MGALPEAFLRAILSEEQDKLEDIDHPMMEDLKAVLQGEIIKGYPTLEDIENRMGLYDIKF